MAFLALKKNKSRAHDSVRGATVAVVDRLLHFLEIHRNIGQNFEPDFMNLGEALQAVYTDSTQLTQQILAAVDLLGNEDNGVMADLRRLTEDSLQELRDRGQKIGLNLDAVQSIFPRLSNLVSQAEALNKLGIHLWEVGFNIEVESARTTANLALFASFPRELKQLAAKMRQVATEIIIGSKKEQQEQQTVSKEIAQNLDGLIVLAQEVESAVREAIGCIEEIMGRAVAALKEANDHAKAISSQIGEIVMRIQMHDRMSQLIAHIVQTLTTAVDLLDQSGDDVLEGERLEMLTVLRQLILLQCAQIRRIIDETVEANRKGREAFQVIDQRVEALGHSFSTLSLSPADNNISEETTDPLSLLEAVLDRLKSLLGEGATMINHLNESGRQISSMTGRLVDHMKGIESIRADLHIKALNTMVMAARLGDHGRTMEVLAQETKALSEQAYGFVDSVKDIHIIVVETVQAFQDEDDNRDGCEDRGALLGNSMQTISEIIERFNRESAATIDHTDVLRNAIIKANDGLEFLGRLEANLIELHGELEAIAEFITPWAGKTDASFLSDKSELAEVLRKEQELQAALLRNNDSSFRATRPAAKESDDDEPFFIEAPAPDKTVPKEDNIEFF
jgi:methyl-accepting chemotaxis protein